MEFGRERFGFAVGAGENGCQEKAFALGFWASLIDFVAFYVFL